MAISASSRLDPLDRGLSLLSISGLVFAFGKWTPCNSPSLSDDAENGFRSWIFRFWGDTFFELDNFFRRNSSTTLHVSRKSFIVSSHRMKKKAKITHLWGYFWFKCRVKKCANSVPSYWYPSDLVLTLMISVQIDYYREVHRTRPLLHCQSLRVILFDPFSFLSFAISTYLGIFDFTNIFLIKYEMIVK